MLNINSALITREWHLRSGYTVLLIFLVILGNEQMSKLKVHLLLEKLVEQAHSTSL